MKIGILQINPTLGQVQENAAAILAAAAKAAAAGAELCVASELVLCGHPPSDLLLRDSFADLCGKTLQEMAVNLLAKGLPPVLLGAPVANPVAQGKRIHNSAVLLREGKVTVIGRKVLLPCEDALDDMRYFEPGVACGMLQYKGWRLAVTVGEDIWSDRTFWQGRRTFEQDPVAEFMSGGADGLINLTAIPYRIGGAAQHERMLGWTAVRYRVPLLCVNQVGGQDGLIYAGRSAFFNIFGTVTARAAAFAEDVLLVDLIQPGETPASDTLESEAELWQALVLGTRDFVRKCGFSKVVLGLSGGLDSSLVAAIAAEALGPDKVLGVLLPSPYTSEESITLAQALAKELGISTKTIPLGPLMQSFDEGLAPIFAGKALDVTEENIQSRIRSTLLMALSNKFGHMLLNTGNKSESAVGYCTLYGDSCGALCVIGDVYKTQAYALCRWLNKTRGREVIPARVLDRPPSAELRPGQVDQDSLPPYDVLDAILHDYIEENMDEDTLLQVGYEKATIDKVLSLIRKSEFKRCQAPPSLRVSSRAFGPGWHMPIARGAV